MPQESIREAVVDQVAGFVAPQIKETLVNEIEF